MDKNMTQQAWLGNMTKKEYDLGLSRFM